jgi:hypothetical protein
MTFIGTQTSHLQGALPCVGHRNSFGAVKGNTNFSAANAGCRMAQRHGQQNISKLVCYSTSQAEGFRSGSSTSWAVEINRNIVIAVDASEVGLRLDTGHRNLNYTG